MSNKIHHNSYSRKLLAKLPEALMAGVCSNTRYIPLPDLTHKCTILVLPSSKQVLLAACDIKPNQTIFEIQGKYRLANELYIIENGISPLTPFVFFYKIPETDIEICVDSRASFAVTKYIRRSITPNAQIKHFIRASSIHLYVVARTFIRKSSEILIASPDPGIRMLMPGVPIPLPVPANPETRRLPLLRRKRNRTYRRIMPRKPFMVKVAQCPFSEDNADTAENNASAVEDNDGGENMTTEEVLTASTTSEVSSVSADASTSGNLEQNEEDLLSDLTQVRSSPVPVVESFADDAQSLLQTRGTTIPGVDEVASGSGVLCSPTLETKAIASGVLHPPTPEAKANPHASGSSDD